MNITKLVTIIVNYNGYDDTVECIDSVRRSSVHSDIILVDNASKTNEYDKLKLRFPDLIVIVSERNLGFAGGNNLGIKLAIEKGYEYICLLNNDTVISTDLLEKLVKNASPSAISVPIMYYYSSKDTIWYGGGSINRWTGNSVHYSMGSSNLKTKNKISFATGCCLMLHKETIKQVGFLDESYFMYCEDTDFCIRCNQLGISIKFVKDAKLWHKVGQSTGGEESAFCIYYMTRNRLNYIKKYKHYFHCTAYIFSLFSRYIRMFQYKLKKKDEWMSFKKGIMDNKKGVRGQGNL